jgi:hypothetical protein
MKITLSRLSVTSLEWLAGTTIDKSMTEKYDIAKDHPLLLNLKKEYERYNEVFDKKTYSGKGKLVAKANVLRNEAFIGLKFCIYGLTKVNGNSKQQDAVDLYRIFKRFGLDLNRKNYMAKSATLSKLIEELSTPENKQKIERIQQTELLEILSAAQDNFEKLVLEQTEANAQLRMMESATSLRGNLEMALGNYFKVVTAMKEFDGWDDLYRILNEYVKSVRHSHLAKKETTQATEEVQPEATKEE